MALTRRESLKAAGATAALASVQPAFATQPAARGYGTDPTVTQPKVTWPMTLTRAQLATLAAVCAVVLPATDGMPSAIELKVPAFVDEWVSAPYPNQKAEREIILSALAALDVAARAAGQPSFAKAAAPATIFAAAWAAPVSAPLLRTLVQLLTGGYVSTNKGMEAIGFVGNVARERFDGPPPRVHAHFDKVVAGMKA